jgi:hypothetical protein
MIWIWDEDEFAAAGLEWRREGDRAFFTTPPTPPDEVMVRLDGETLLFVPERSAGHRRVLAQLAAGSESQG